MSGGANEAGTVYEIVKTGSGYSSPPTTVFNFSSGEGSAYGGVFIDKDGNLVGTTDRGGTSGDGEVFEITTTGGVTTLNVLFSFDDSNGAHPQAGLTADAAGNLFGTTKEEARATTAPCWRSPTVGMSRPRPATAPAR